VQWSGHKPDASRASGTLFYSNHPGWWDPALFALLQSHFMPGRPGFGPIDARTLKRYPTLNRAGFLPLDPSSHNSLRQFLDQSKDILKSGGVFWLTAQGQFADVRLRPVRLKSGLAHIASQATDCMIIPVAIEYVYGSESRAEAFIRFGQPVPHSSLPGSLTAKHAFLEDALETTQDALAADVITRDHARFQLLLEGRSGMGGLYAQLQKLSSLMRREKHDPRHAGR